MTIFIVREYYWCDDNNSMEIGEEFYFRYHETAKKKLLEILAHGKTADKIEQELNEEIT